MAVAVVEVTEEVAVVRVVGAARAAEVAIGPAVGMCANSASVAATTVTQKRTWTRRSVARVRRPVQTPLPRVGQHPSARAFASRNALLRLWHPDGPRRGAGYPPRTGAKEGAAQQRIACGDDTRAHTGVREPRVSAEAGDHSRAAALARDYAAA